MNDDLKQIKEYMGRSTWDYPRRPDEMRIPAYDVNSNPTQIDFYLDGVIIFTHELTWDVDGNLTVKKLVTP